MKVKNNKILVIGLAGILFFSSLFFVVIARAVTSTSTAGTTTVTATVPSGDGGGGGGGGSGDSTAPANISNLTVSNITATSVTLTWTAVGDDGNSGTATGYFVRYATSGYINDETKWGAATLVSSPPTPTLAGTAQSFIVSGLNSGTTYYFAIKVTDEVSNWSGLSNSPSGATGVVVDTVAPEISNIQVAGFTTSTATISWATNENATSSLLYGKTTAYEIGTLISSQLVTSRSFNLSGLQEKTLYHFQAVSADASNNAANSADQTFTTLETVAPPADITPPIISGIVVAPRSTYAVITWTTDEPADSQVAYGLTDALGTIKSVIGLRASHSITLGSLSANTKYYYAVRSTDAVGNQGAGATASFTTLPDVSPPANVGNLVATVGNQQVTLRWQNPGDADFSNIIIRRSTTDFPHTISEGTQVYSGTAEEFINAGLTNGILYYYTVFSRDVSNNYASGALVSVAPTGETPPPPPPPLPPPEEPPVVPPGGEPETGPTGNVSVAAPTAGSTVSGLSLSDLELFTARRALRLTLSNGRTQVLSGQDLIASFNPRLSSRALKDLTLKIGDSAYLMVTDRFGNHSADVTMPTAPGSYGISAIFEFQDGAPDELRFIVDVAPGGFVYTVKNNEQIPVAGAEVSAYKRNNSGAWELWNADAYHQANPQKTIENGGYGFAIPNGEYFLRVSHDGYRAQDTGAFFISNLSINLGVELFAIPPPLKIDLELPIMENVKEVAKNLGQKTVFAAKVAGEEVQKAINNPKVKKTVEETAAPVVTGAAVVGTVAAAGTQILNYLRFLFTQPILFFFRRKRKGWGLVYNSLTKMPVDLAIVRLVDAVSGRITQSRVTDKEGRYAFIASPGRFKLELNQDQFVFPTKFLADLKEDGVFVDIYHGEVIEVTEQGALITANIPLDPVGAEKPAGMILRQLFFRKAQNILAVVSILVSVAFVYITPGWLTGGLLAIQVASYVVFRRFAVPPKPKSWGIIYDEQNKQPLVAVVARIFDKQYNKLLETQITDAKGRYSFLVGRNEYYITYEKSQYEKKTSASIDLRQNSDPSTTIGVDTGLKRAGIV